LIADYPHHTTTEADAPEIPPRDTDPLMDKREMPFRGVFYPLGFCVEIYTNACEVLEAANESWAHLRPSRMNASIRLCIGVNDSTLAECPPAPTVRAQGHLLTIIADAENQATADLDAAFGFMWVSSTTVHHRLYFRYHFLEALALVIVSGTFAPAIHAACVSHRGRGLLLIGPSGAGKSTLAYACARAGFTYISDDASYLLRDADHPRVVGHSHKFRFRPSSRELFPELQGYELAPRLEGKPSIEVQTSELHGLLTSKEARIHYLILLRRSGSANARLTPASSDSAVAYLEEGLYPVGEIRRSQVTTLQRLATLQAFELHYSDLCEAILCLQALTSAPESRA